MKSLAHRIALRFSLVIAVFVVFLSVAVVGLLRRGVRMREGRELTEASEQIARRVLKGADPHSLTTADLQGIPYYLTYTVYDAGSSHVISTNDPFIPVLPLTQGKTVHWTQKEYYTDGDLNLLYCSKVFRPGESLAVQAALNMDQDTAEQLLGYLPRTLAFIFIPLLVLSYAAAFLIARQTLRPVSRITEQARHIGSASLDARLPVTKQGDELDTLAGTFNDLFARLKVDFDRERSFTSDVSHELKTPIAVILGHANLIRRWGKDDPEQLQDSIGELIAEAHSMESVVSNMLQMSRLESGSCACRRIGVELKPLFMRLVKDTHGWNEQAEICVKGGDFAVYGDEELLYQVFTVIVSNSIKFSPAPVHSTVESSACGDGKRIRIVISDDGPGIASDVLPHVFERFYRGDVSHHRAAGGAGLGLSIAKEIMESMHGTISASSLEKPEHGAVITLELDRAD